jgi:hypothetical protein
VTCRHNLLVDVGKTGINVRSGSHRTTIGIVTDDSFHAITDAAIDSWIAECPPSCALDVVDANPDGMCLADIGDVLGLTRERARQVEDAAIDRAAKASVLR